MDEQEIQALINPDGFCKKLIIERLATDNNLSAACRTARISRRKFFEWMDDDPRFRMEVDDAINEYKDILRGMAHKLGVEGVERGVYYKGERIGEEIHYSESMLKMLLQVHDSRFRNLDGDGIPQDNLGTGQLTEQALRSLLQQSLSEGPIVEVEFEEISDERTTGEDISNASDADSDPAH